MALKQRLNRLSPLKRVLHHLAYWPILPLPDIPMPYPCIDRKPYLNVLTLILTAPAWLPDDKNSPTKSTSVQRLIHYQLQQSIIQADETPVQVLNEPGRKAQSQSYMWLYQSGSSGASPPVIIHDYQPGRSGLFAKNHLQDFKGQYLQTDGYSGYAQVCTPQSGIVSVGCQGSCPA